MHIWLEPLKESNTCRYPLLAIRSLPETPSFPHSYQEQILKDRQQDGADALYILDTLAWWAGLAAPSTTFVAL